MSSNVVRIDNTEFKVDKGVAKPPICNSKGARSSLRLAVKQMEAGDSMFVEGHSKQSEVQAGKISYALNQEGMKSSRRKLMQDPVTGQAGFRVWRVS